MDKRNFKKPEQAERKTEIKDRGDLNKDRSNKKNIDSDINVKITHPGGDTDKKPNKEKPKPILNKILEITKKEQQLTKDSSIKRENVETELAQFKNHVEKEEKRKIREKSTLQLKNANFIGPANHVKREEGAKISVKTNADVNRIEHVKKPPITKDKTDSSQNSISKEKVLNETRRPSIKTVTSKNDSTKIYKAVTFTDQKRSKILQVKIPNEKSHGDNKNIPEMSATKQVSTTSNVNLEKSILKKRGERMKQKKKRLIASPDHSARIKSPSTEVAKWAPSSYSHHTKPYYEAWVSTTLAAISKTARKDRLFLEKQNILHNFQRTLNLRPDTPDLMYENLIDEKYTGKIKVKQR